MARQPLGLHAVTHLANGQDPLPGTSWAYMSTVASQSIAGDNAQHFLDLDATNFTKARFYTNDTDTFDFGQHTISGTPYYGLKISLPGTFLLAINGIFQSLSAGHTALVYYSASATAGVGPATSAWQFGRTAVNTTDTWDEGANDHISFMELLAVQGLQDSLDGNTPATGGTPVSNNDNLPVFINLYGQQSTGSAHSLAADLVMVKFGPGVFYPGSWL